MFLKAYRSKWSKTRLGSILFIFISPDYANGILERTIKPKDSSHRESNPLPLIQCREDNWYATQ